MSPHQEQDEWPAAPPRGAPRKTLEETVGTVLGWAVVGLAVAGAVWWYWR